MDWKTLVLPLAGLVGALLHGWLSNRPTDQERALHLAQMAHDAAALVSMTFPTLPEKDLIAKVVEQLASAAGVPTVDAGALQRAAAGAISELKAKPLNGI